VKLFKKNKRQKQTMVLQGQFGKAAKAVYEGRGQMPSIEMQFKIRHGYDKVRGEEFDEVIIEMDALEANDFARELLAALNAALPQVARGTQRTQYGE
jgi:hypothetical protein